MQNDRVSLSGSELVRWMVVAAIVIAGIILFFWFAPTTRPAVAPSVQEPPR